MKKRTVLITGASSGIGKATALQFAQEKANLIITHYNNLKGAQNTAKACQKLGSDVTIFPLLCGDEKQTKEIINLIKKKYNQLDVLINNAGAVDHKEFSKLTINNWKDMFNANFFGAVLLTQQALFLMKNKSSILFTSSMRGFDYCGNSCDMPYSASKAALNSFVKTLAKEVATKEITVNAVAPGYTKTKIIAHWNKKQEKEKLKDNHLKHIIKPEEIAQMFYFLSTARSITGQIVTVDCGFTLK